MSQENVEVVRRTGNNFNAFMRGELFRKLWGETKAQQSKFRSYVKYYLSDHRPLWAQLRI